MILKKIKEDVEKSLLLSELYTIKGDGLNVKNIQENVIIRFSWRANI
jgi:hypothetical protein